MKLLRYGPAGTERPGIIGTDGQIRDLSSAVADIEGETLNDAELDRLRNLDTDTLPAVNGEVRLGAPVANVGKFIGVGLNYRDHAEEAGMAIPDEPILFTKAVSSISGPNDEIAFPADSAKGDWEVELAVVIGRTAKDIAADAALAHIAGYCACNDVSERSYQLDGTGQWLKGKSRDSWGPLGPWLVTRDEVPDPQNLTMWLDVNGERRQSGNTSTMIFPVTELVSYISRFLTLHPGDVIATGTPPGVAMGMTPPQWLQPGDDIRLSVESLGEQRHTVVTG